MKNDSLENGLLVKLKILIIGFISLSVGLFPYVAVRQTYCIDTAGLNGRDATLISFGAAMLIYGIVDIFVKEWAQKYIFVSLIFGGIVFFNTYYLSYQQDYYRQLGFQYQLSQNLELNDAKNIVYVNSDPGLINIQSFYSLNGNAEEIFGVQNKFIVSGTDKIIYFDSDTMNEFVSSGKYHMSDYDLTHKRIDAIVNYSLDITLRDTAKMKIYELFRNKRFDNWIQNRSSMDIYWCDTEEFSSFVQEKGYEDINLQ